LDFFEKILDLFFPPVCGICGKINKNSLCDGCNKNLQSKKTCKIDYYQNEDIFYEEHFYIFKYDGIIRDKIIDYKFNDKAYLYKTFEKIILNDKKICDFIKSYDIIIPVPIHKKRKLIRGYNQSELIIKEVARNLRKQCNIELDNMSLMKIKNAEKQSLLTKEQRTENIKNSYELQKSNIEKLKGKKILIFDDIFTTGSTANECSKTLMLAKPKKIGILTIAKD
jgi:ComF family protein